MVDDEKSYVDLLAHMLAENLGCPVLAFTRPLDALHALRDANDGAVVTDYHMPQMDGFEFVRRAAELQPRVPFIMISGHTIDPDGDDFGADRPLRALLAKPFGWRRLAEEIVRHAPEFAANLDRADGGTASA